MVRKKQNHVFVVERRCLVYNRDHDCHGEERTYLWGEGTGVRPAIFSRRHGSYEKEVSVSKTLCSGHKENLTTSVPTN